MWLIANSLHKPLDRSLIYVADYPHTAAYCCRKQMQIDSFMELPKDKRPPKCLHPDTKIYVRRNNLVSYISLGNLYNKKQFLDEYKILSHTGWKGIFAVREVEQNLFAEICVAKVSTIYCSLDHRFPISSRGNFSKELPLKAAKDIKLSKESCYYKNYFLHKTINKFLDGKIHSLYTLDLNYNLGFLLGIYAAEGGLHFWTTRITMNSKERKVLKKLSKTAQEIKAKKIRIFRNKSDKPTVLRLKFSSKSFVRLARLLCSGNVYTKKLNLNIILNTPESFRQGIFDGYIQGDGALKRNGTTSFISASKDLRDTMIILASSIGRLFSKNSYKTLDARYNKVRTSYISWSRDGGKKRQHRLVHGNSQLPTRNIKFIEKAVRFIDIEVEGGIFLIDSGILSHNSIWNEPEELERWFDRVLRNEPTELEFTIDEVEG